MERPTQTQNPQMHGRLTDKMNFQSLYLIINLLINKPRRNFRNHTQHGEAGSSDEYRKGKPRIATTVTEGTLGRRGVPQSIP